MSVDIGSIKGTVELEDKFSNALTNFDRKLNDAVNGIRSTGSAVDQLGNKLQNTGSAIAATFVGMFSAEVAIKAVRAGVGLLVDEISKLTLGGAAVADVEENFNRLASQAGVLGESLLGPLREGSHNTITDFKLMKIVNGDLAAGMVLTGDQFKTLSKGAFALAQATGVDVESAFEKMNAAMLRGKTRSIAALTGAIDLKDAQLKYADSLHKTVEQLTSSEKLEATRAAILDKVAAATKRLGEQTDGIDEMVAQVATAWKNFEEELGKTIATSPEVLEAFKGIKDALASAFGNTREQAIKTITSLIADFATGVKDLIPIVASITKALGDFFSFLLQHTDTIKTVTIAVGSFTAAWLVMSVGGTVVTSVTAGFAAIGVAAEALAAGSLVTLITPIGAIALAVAGLGTAIYLFRKEMFKLDPKVSSTGKHLDGLKDSTGHLVMDVDEAKIALEKLQGQMQPLANGTSLVIGGIKKVSEVTNTLTDDEKKLQQKIADTERQMRSMTPAIIESIQKWKDFGLGNSEIATKLKLTDLTISTVIKNLETQDKALEDTVKGFASYGKEGAAGVKSVADGLKGQPDVLMHLAQAMGNVGLESKNLKNNMGPLADTARDAKDRMDGLREALDHIGTNLKTTFKTLPDILIQAFSNGGKLVGAIQAFGVQLAKDILGPLTAKLGGRAQYAVGSGSTVGAGLGARFGGNAGSIIGGTAASIGGAVVGATMGTAAATVGGALALGAATAGIGAAAVGLFVVLKGLFNNVEKEVNKTRQAFVDASGGLEALNVSAANAGVTLTALLDAKTPAAYTAALNELNAALKFQDESMKFLDDTVKKYGFSISELGPTMQKQELDKQAINLTKEFRALEASGISVENISVKMSDGINDYLHNALKTGQEVPEAMKEILNQLAVMGMLTDDAGNKIDDVNKAGIKWGKDSGSATDSLTKAIEKLISAIERGLNPAIASIPTNVRTDYEYRTRYTYEGNPPPHTQEPPDVPVVPQAMGGEGRTMGPTLFYSAGNEDFAFSGEGKRFKNKDGSADQGSSGGNRELFALLPSMLKSAIRDGFQEIAGSL